MHFPGEEFGGKVHLVGRTTDPNVWHGLDNRSGEFVDVNLRQWRFVRRDKDPTIVYREIPDPGIEEREAITQAYNEWLTQQAAAAAAAPADAGGGGVAAAPALLPPQRAAANAQARRGHFAGQ